MTTQLSLSDLRCCQGLLLQWHEEASVDIAELLAGGTGLSLKGQWRALAPHLETPIVLTPAQWALLTALTTGSEPPLIQMQALEQALQELLASALVTYSKPMTQDHADLGPEQWWWPLAAVMHRMSRWHGVDSAHAAAQSQTLDMVAMAGRYGPAPSPAPHVDAALVFLPKPPPDSFDLLLAQRTTCRNFDTDKALPALLFGQMLQRTFAAHGHVQVTNGPTLLKRNAPSGGGLHPIDAYLLVRNVDGIEPGLYRYAPLGHALQPLPAPPEGLDEFAMRAVSQQHWFAQAHVLVMLVANFPRSFWKYRRHAKAYRVAVLDAGHLSQLLYLAATQAGLGAFVTAAINEVDIEQSLDLQPLSDSPLAVCGFGWRSGLMTTTEFDPTGSLWRAPASPPPAQDRID
ncbi:putative peptide maturation dehydrogenase [Pseudoxanthomonas sp. GM95]|uniref:putative peptide maturation dehydrogenase n=1 Tax=Pseudoxanthomonas sp. GM95 TaxID=1881043 RepID=UPI0008AE5876|nr:putative peptide maturation dehydrogenase [Pseudoxanthomonas sp. GM95]SEL93582.1 putative peptide maturation dehydrogenase [Pseudoxanthomonas sp. GM95]